MTDNEIKKAFKICNNLEDGYCSDCPYEYCDRCIREVATNTLDLINRLQAEVEDKDILLNHQGEVIKTLEQACKEQMAENERLQKDSKRLKKVQMQLDDLCIMHNIIKAEAYKEFAEELLETKFKHGNDYIIYAANIDNLLKEKVGEDNG